MVVCSGRNPELWLESWLHTPFYDGEKCETHILKYNTIFCAVCMGSPVCETCWKCRHSKLHQGHLTLQVCSSSGRAAIDIQEIRKYIDVSGIQLYKINDKDIVFLKPNRDGLKIIMHMFPSNYKNVERKIEIGEQRPMRKRRRKSTAGEGECSSGRAMRKRSRKGTPGRAPFW
ncbi:UNVERIFIED_CONTAM: hypothetical protein Sangu_2887200 [Sesamum angustifolium]|uniref:Uncharacterized protein n=1 Tax=Sesamum angustifolium TaxID=2727405 RepID=A0AAW2INA9_9LAMI